MARYDDRTSDDRRRQDRWRHAEYGTRWRPGQDVDADYGIDRPPPRGDYYDPDHGYRSRRFQRDTDRERPYGQRAIPGEHGERGQGTHGQGDEEHAWSDPGSWYGGGRYRGVGPKGYVRSDERIRELVCDELMDDPWVDASGIEVAVKDGEVTLSGTVENRDAKRWAEDIAHHAGGVKHVQNNLRIA
jgi:hypothetical protein